MASSGILCKAFKSDFTVPLGGRTSCTRGLRVFVCEFSSLEECKRFYYITECMHMYVRYVRRSLAAVGGRFDG